jgi:hypothetical protein
MNIQIPIQFAEKKVRLRWADLLWGYEKALITWRDLVYFAKEKEIDGVADELELELSTVDKNCVWKVRELAENLRKNESFKEDDLKNNWMFLTLSWIYENRENFADPLELVEEVYADYGYPDQLIPFVRFIPPLDGYDPASHTKEENVDRLMKNWESYLNCYMEFVNRTM